MMSESLRVVVVDDEAQILEAIGRMLEGDGYAVELYQSPSEAYDACAEAPPEFLITDFLMAEMSGAELAAKLRQQLGRRTPRIICVTAWLEKLRKDQERVFDTVLQKPFAYCDLVRTLDELEELGPRPSSHHRLKFPWVGDEADDKSVAG